MPSGFLSTARGAPRRWGLVASAVAGLFALAAQPGTAHAQAGLANLAAVQPTSSCSGLLTADFSGVTDGTVTITSATVLAKGASASRYTLPSESCVVNGSIGPGVNQFAMILPTQTWKQRYIQSGCGGLCGSIGLSVTQASGCVPVTNGEVAIAATDMGHSGGNDGSWAKSAQARLDFAYRGQHVTAQVAKAIIAKYYGQAPKYSYFDGCSDGGREALMEAQRYPNDFDGISAGAPANDLDVQNTFHHGWNALTNRKQDGTYTLIAGKLPLIHAAVVAACDSLDGVADGILDDPRRCNFNPSTLLCKSGQDPSTCLSAAEVAVVQRLHDGPTEPYGRHLEQPIAHEWGSELDWTLFVPQTTAGPSGSINFVLPYARYLAYHNQAVPNWQITDLKFTIPYFYQTVETSHYWSATNPDVKAFEQRGGKLLLWHGWSDQHITPQGTIDYYMKMRDFLGASTADTFSRLYLFPGMGHCGGGLGPNTFDIVTPLMAWVETGTVPGEIVASLNSGGTSRTRPVYPYPAVARYKGTGSTDVAANFTSYTPPSEPNVSYAFVGSGLYNPGTQAQCTVQNNQLVCTGGAAYPWEGSSAPDYSISHP